MMRSGVAATAIDSAVAFARRRSQTFVGELQKFVRFGSVSSEPEHSSDIRLCARWLAEHMRRIGLERVAVDPTSGHPIVSGDWGHAPGQPRVLIYGHYDVQPADPGEGWRSPPFEPVVRGNYLYGRGSADDKGQLFVHLKAIEAYLSSVGRLPVNVKCVFEGEEEIGSPNLRSFIEPRHQALAAEVAVVSDMLMAGPGRPAVTYAMRGMLTAEIEVEGARYDLHSGNFGGAVHNPLEAICGMIDRLHDSKGYIAVPGFYDDVRPCSPDERKFMAQNGPSDTELLQDMEARRGWGEPGFSLYERTTVRPALTVNGIAGGYKREGPKSVLPARAVAKLDVRLVPNQEPGEIARLLRNFIAQITPPTVQSRLLIGASAEPVVVNRSHPVVGAMARACAAGFGVKPVFRRLGGTIPIVHTLVDTLNVPVAMIGFATPHSRIHAPDERLYLPDFFKGIDTSIHFLAELGANRRANADLGLLQEPSAAHHTVLGHAEA
jgi:acetylornithine deacetylase/succinyl-diaminopimelate desuccinylase-like protein